MVNYFSALDSALKDFNLADAFLFGDFPGYPYLWSVVGHEFVRVERRKFLGLFPYDASVPVASIVSQPRCGRDAFAHVDTTFSFAGMRIRVLDSTYDDSIRTIARRLEQTLSEPVDVI